MHPAQRAMTVQEVKDLAPWQIFAEERILELFAGRAALNIDDVAALDLFPCNKVWILLEWPGLTLDSVILPFVNWCKAAVDAATQSEHNSARMRMLRDYEAVMTWANKSCIGNAAHFAYDVSFDAMDVFGDGGIEEDPTHGDRQVSELVRLIKELSR